MLAGPLVAFGAPPPRGRQPLLADGDRLGDHRPRVVVLGTLARVASLALGSIPLLPAVAGRIHGWTSSVFEALDERARADVAKAREVRQRWLALGPEGGIDQRGGQGKSPNGQ